MNTVSTQFKDWMQSIQLRTENALTFYLPQADTQPARLHEAMRYATLDGGKRVRPLLVHAAGQISQAPSAVLDACACAIECIHVYSLVHDDMPCMDDDALRRGKPTVHIAYDEATALLVGDALQSLAFQILSTPINQLEPARSLQMLQALTQASGSQGMAGGQAIDLFSVGQMLSRNELEQMHRYKTGALIRCAVQLGLLAGQANPNATQTLDQYSTLLGLLFQVVDDVLDAQASTETLGKTAGKDAANNKPTYVSLLGLEAAQKLSHNMLEQALSLLEPLGENAQCLRDLAKYVVHRTF